MRKIAILVNVGAGSAGEEEAEQRYWDELCQEAGLDAHIELVKGGDLVQRCQELADSKRFDVIAAAGGDGTQSTVAGVLHERDHCMGVLPRGTLNHFSKDLGIPQTMPEALAVLHHGEECRVDLAEVNGRIFVNNSSIGIYSKAVLERDQALRRGGNKWVHMTRAFFKQWLSFPTYRVRIESDAFKGLRKASLLFIGNNRYELAFPKPGTRNALDGGLLCLYIPRATTRMGLVRQSIRAWLGLAFKDTDFDTLDSAHIRIDSKRSRLTVSIDGEVTSMRPPLDYRILPKALRVMAPQTKPHE